VRLLLLYISENPLKFHTITMLVVSDLQTTMNTRNENFLILIIPFKFDMPSSSDTLVVAIKPITTENCHTSTMLLFLHST
jgi:hypothetical protein